MTRTKGVTRMRLQLQYRVLRRLRVTPLGFCLRIIVKKKSLNLKKTTSSVISGICKTLKCLRKNTDCINKTLFLRKEERAKDLHLHNF